MLLSRNFNFSDSVIQFLENIRKFEDSTRKMRKNVNRIRRLNSTFDSNIYKIHGIVSFFPYQIKENFKFWWILKIRFIKYY